MLIISIAGGILLAGGALVVGFLLLALVFSEGFRMDVAETMYWALVDLARLVLRASPYVVAAALLAKHFVH
jgi:hypothetical protein